MGANTIGCREHNKPEFGDNERFRLDTLEAANDAAESWTTASTFDAGGY